MTSLSLSYCVSSIHLPPFFSSSSEPIVIVVAFWSCFRVLASLSYVLLFGFIYILLSSLSYGFCVHCLCFGNCPEAENIERGRENKMHEIVVIIVVGIVFVIVAVQIEDNFDEDGDNECLHSSLHC